MIFNKEDYDWMTEFHSVKKNTITNAELEKLSRLHAHYFNHTYYKPCKCPSRSKDKPSEIQRFINDLNKLYDSGYTDGS